MDCLHPRDTLPTHHVVGAGLGSDASGGSVAGDDEGDAAASTTTAAPLRRLRATVVIDGVPLGRLTGGPRDRLRRSVAEAFAVELKHVRWCQLLALLAVRVAPMQQQVASAEPLSSTSVQLKCHCCFCRWLSAASESASRSPGPDRRAAQQRRLLRCLSNSAPLRPSAVIMPAPATPTLTGQVRPQPHALRGVLEEPDVHP